MKKLYSFLVLFTLLFCSTGNVWGETLGPLYNGTNSSGSSIPVEGNNIDRLQRVQVIYPKADLAAMAGKSITKMTFYVSSAASKAWNAPIQIRLAEISDDYFATSSYKSGDWTLVYEGTDLSATGSTMEVTFNKSSFAYSGNNNLLFELITTGTTGAYAKATFNAKGGYDYNYSVYKYSTSVSSALDIASGTGKPVRPKTLFTYENPPAAACAKPSVLTLSSISTNTATFTWTAGGSESSWQYICLPAATAVDWNSSSVKTATAASATVTGLEASTAYKFYVRADCGSDQSDEVSKQFTTPCTSVSNIEAYGFEDVTTGSEIYNIPDCWSRIAYASLYGTLPYVYYGSTEAYSGNKCLYFRGGGSSSSQIIVLQPITSPNELAISFWYRNHAVGASSYGKLQIGYMTNPEDASTFTTFTGGTLDQVTSYTQVESFPLSEAPSSAYIAIRYSGGSSNYGSAYIDDITVSTPQTCYKPASIADASSITSDGATLSWTASGHGETTYQWAVAEGSADPVWVDDAEHKVSTTSKELTGLEPNTDYTFYVRSYCGADDQSGALSKAFKTRCGTISESLWEYGFEDDGIYDVPTCWKTYAGASYFAYVLGSNFHSGNKAMSIAAGKTDAYRTYVILPKFDLALSNLSITFYYRGTANATIEVGYVTDVDDKTTFVKIGDALTAATTYKQGFTSFASVAATGQIAFRFKGTATGDGDFNIDDIRVARTVTLADNVDNSSLISSLAAEGETIDILLKRKIWMDGYYNTICLPFSLSADQLADEDCPLNNFKLKVFDYTRTENDEVHMFITGASSIEAGVPYFASYQGTPTTDKTEHLFRDVQVTASTAGEKNSEIVTYKGFYAPKVLANQTSNDPYPVIFYLSRNNTIYWPNQDVNLGGFRAYFDVDYSAGAPGRPIRRIIFADQQEDTATGVDKVESGKLKVESRKFIENGQLYIIRDGEKYTVLGQKIQ